ncbi:MAG TPA: Lrp/AsnC family transcriptional regulator [Dokdonella sp.]|uniref:Lrp/AsnC family transcriptional regulator n=1 Tax=Dokdonella sp. TaxID=2291710 RepID=UPI002D7FA07E|nr:Lrp/AsnC family transcriptional regulator [Dokdonella sp.]HET9031964.1 Lrp/AsnC family transcriptional regulator [Dokdonella sp.]
MLDRTDIELLRLLRKNARLPNKTLAEKTGIAQSTALERVRRLRESGVLEGYHAEVLPAAIGIGLQVMVAVRMSRHSRELIDSFVAHMSKQPEILAHYHVAGADDFLVHLVARDADHLRELTMSIFTEREEVAHIQTNLIFAFQRNTDLPIYLDTAEE